MTFCLYWSPRYFISKKLPTGLQGTRGMQVLLFVSVSKIFIKFIDQLEKYTLSTSSSVVLGSDLEGVPQW